MTFAQSTGTSNRFRMSKCACYKIHISVYVWLCGADLSTTKQRCLCSYTSDISSYIANKSWPTTFRESWKLANRATFAAQNIASSANSANSANSSGNSDDGRDRNWPAGDVRAMPQLHAPQLTGRTYAAQTQQVVGNNFAGSQAHCWIGAGQAEMRPRHVCAVEGRASPAYAEF